MLKEPIKEYLLAAAEVLGASLVCLAAHPFLEPINLVMIYLLGMLLVAGRGHRGPAAVSAALSVLTFDFFFIPPRFTFTVENVQYLLTFVAMAATALVVSHLAQRLRIEAESAREGERRTTLMYDMTRHLSGARTRSDIIRLAAQDIGRALNADVSIYLPGDDGRVFAAMASQPPSDHETKAAQWVFENGTPSAAPSTTLPLSAVLLTPISGNDGCTGVIGVRPNTGDRAIGGEQRQLLNSLVHQVALAMEVDRLDGKSRKAEIEGETERLRSALLSSVSHDLQTPLAAIVGSASTLLTKEEIRRSPGSVSLAENIQSEGERLSRLLRNLLQATRLQSGAVQVRKELHSLEEVVGAALGRLEKAIAGRAVSVQIPEDLPSLPVDVVLFEQALFNLIDNAIRHTPPGTPVDLTARRIGDHVEVLIADRGPGLPAPDHERVFEKFFRTPSSLGTGLGLTICRAILVAHGGNVDADDRVGGGAVFRITLPLGGLHGV